MWYQLLTKLPDSRHEALGLFEGCDFALSQVLEQCPWEYMPHEHARLNLILIAMAKDAMYKHQAAAIHFWTSIHLNRGVLCFLFDKGSSWASPELKSRCKWSPAAHCIICIVTRGCRSVYRRHLAHLAIRFVHLSTFQKLCRKRRQQARLKQIGISLQNYLHGNGADH